MRVQGRDKSWYNWQVKKISWFSSSYDIKKIRLFKTNTLTFNDSVLENEPCFLFKFSSGYFSFLSFFLLPFSFFFSSFFFSYLPFFTVQNQLRYFPFSQTCSSFPLPWLIHAFRLESLYHYSPWLSPSRSQPTAKISQFYQCISYFLSPLLVSFSSYSLLIVAVLLSPCLSNSALCWRVFFWKILICLCDFSSNLEFLLPLRKIPSFLAWHPAPSLITLMTCLIYHGICQFRLWSHQSKWLAVTEVPSLCGSQCAHCGSPFLRHLKFYSLSKARHTLCLFCETFPDLPL